MRHLSGIALVLVFVGLAASSSLRAETAFTNKPLNLRAGPGRDYPLVARIGSGTAVDVGGCTDDYAWCDVAFEGDHGWAWAGNLEYPYEGRRVVIYGHGPVIGLPIMPFVAGTYWDTYYRGRPWYGRRSYWVGRPYVGRPYVGRPVVGRPPGYRPPVGRPYAGRPPASRPPVVVRPPASRAPVARPELRREVRPQTRQPERRPPPPREKRPDRKSG